MDARTLEDAFQLDHQIVYYTFQLERAPSTGRLHYQWYIRFTNAVPLSRVAKLFDSVCGGVRSGVHCEICKGTEDQCVAYCTKEDSRVAGPWQFGERAKAGKRNDLDRVREIIEEGGGMREVAKIAPSYPAIRMAECILKYCEKQRDWETDCRWYYGSTASGKTRSALEEFPDAWISAKNLKWWEGYDAHEHVIVDDFRADFCTFHELLRITDRYPYRIETKGGSRQLLAKVIIFTCPWSIDQLFKHRSEEDVGQLKRRVPVERLFGDRVPSPSKPVLSGGASAPHFRVVPAPPPRRN